ncbi:septum formation initiator family protein [Qipengyuania sp. JC766]|uniref:FtsB family cell division protein n=1 Tax=Qipengyuania sp. JC766 TaxID=3232139 RepID=UPI003458A71D
MRKRHRFDTRRERLAQGAALGVLLLMAGFAFAGPSGLLSWSENSATLDEHRAKIAKLTDEVDALDNRVRLLDPAHADPDLVGELLRRNQNVAHPDEIVLTLPEEE